MAGSEAKRTGDKTLEKWDATRGASGCGPLISPGMHQLLPHLGLFTSVLPSLLCHSTNIEFLLSARPGLQNRIGCMSSQL